MVALRSLVRDLSFDILEVHRIEPLLLFRRLVKPVNAILHQNMNSLYNKNSEIRWARLPGLYFWLEDRLAPMLSSAFCVRTDAVEYYRGRFKHLEDACWFVPTWADPDVFTMATVARKTALRDRLAEQYRLDVDDQWLIMVGRLSSAKNDGVCWDSVIFSW